MTNANAEFEKRFGLKPDEICCLDEWNNLKEGWDAALEALSKPQDSSTCQAEPKHPRWAYLPEPEHAPDSQDDIDALACLVCDGIRKATCFKDAVRAFDEAPVSPEAVPKGEAAMEIATLISHHSLGKECCGCLNGRKTSGMEWLFYCNECGEEIASARELDPQKPYRPYRSHRRKFRH